MIAILPRGQPGRRRRTVTVLLPVVVLCVAGSCALVLADLGAQRFGTTGLAVGAAAALIPVIPVVAGFLWVDRWEPEPARLLLAAFAWGSCVAALTALVVNDTAASLLGAGPDGLVAPLLSAPLAEEALKAVFVVVMWRLLHNEFDGVVDGIVYAGITAAGFAFTENIFYFGSAFVHGGIGDTGSGMIGVFVLRGVFSPFIHPLFSVMTGAGIGLAAATSAVWLRVAAPLGGYLLAVVLHGSWNAAALAADGTALTGYYFLVIVPVLAATVLFAMWQRNREQRVVAAGLPAMVTAGWIAPSEVRLLSSLAGRRRWRAEVRRRSGRTAARAVRRYQIGVTELAFLTDRMARGGASREAMHRRDRLIGAVRQARQDAVDATAAAR